MNNNYESIIGIPKFVGEITTTGKWNGTSEYRDPYSDIAEATSKFPRGEILSYMLVNNKTRYYLYTLDSDRMPFIETIFQLFGHRLPGNSCCDLVSSYIKEIIIKSILCSEQCGMLRKYNTEQGIVLYCGLCPVVERT